MLHQPSLRRALFASRKAGGDVGSRTGVVWEICKAEGDVGNRTGVVWKHIYQIGKRRIAKIKIA
jgi:hypothetical protein